MADNSLPKVPERNLDLVTYEQVKEIRVVDTSDNSKTLAIDNLTIAGTKVTVAVDGLSGTVDGAFGDVLTAIAEKADTTQVEALADVDKANYAKSVEMIAHNATAPSPVIPTGTTKTYEFSSGGSCSWITGGAVTVEKGDKVEVAFIAPSTFVRTYQDVVSRKIDKTAVEQVRSQATDKVPSSKVFDDELVQIENDLNGIVYFDIYQNFTADNTNRFLYDKTGSFGKSVYMKLKTPNRVTIRLYHGSTYKQYAITDFDGIINTPEDINRIWVYYTLGDVVDGRLFLKITNGIDKTITSNDNLIKKQLHVLSSKDISDNIYNAAKAEQGTYLLDNRVEITPNLNFGVSDYILIDGIDELITNCRVGSGIQSMVVYDVDYNIIRGIIDNNQYTRSSEHEMYLKIAYPDYLNGIANVGSVLQGYSSYTEHKTIDRRLDLLEGITPKNLNITDIGWENSYWSGINRYPAANRLSNVVPTYANLIEVGNAYKANICVIDGTSKIGYIDQNLNIVESGVWFFGTIDIRNIRSEHPNYEYNIAFARVDGLDIDISEYVNIKYYKDVYPLATPILTFIDDDGYAEAMDNWESITDETGYSPSVAIITSKVGVDQNTVTWDVLNRLKNKGFDIISHTHNHSYISSLTEEQLDNDFSANISAFKVNGISASHLVYPGNAHNALIDSVAKKYFKSGIEGGNRPNCYPLSNFNIYRYSILDLNSSYELIDGENTYTIYNALDIDTIKNYIDNTINSGGWLIFMTHFRNSYSDHYSFDETIKQRVIDTIKYATEKGMLVKNYSEAFELRKNLFNGDPKIDCTGRTW